MSEVILDTNFLLGLVDEKDKWHSKVIKARGTKENIENIEHSVP